MTKAFISYSHKDSAILDRLHTHLAILRREGTINEWYDRQILAGGELSQEISSELQKAKLFLALVSPDFLSSNYCYEIEMKMAIELHEAGKIRIIPIIVEPCDWQSSPLARFKAIPRDGKPIAEWQNQNNAFLDIVQELRRIITSDISSFGTQAKTENRVFVQPVEEKRYRLKREFDEIDIANFRDKCFKAIRDYFESSIGEVDTIEDVRARFTDINAFSFTCTVLNKAKTRSVGYLTVHAQTGKGMNGAIIYSFTENASINTSNGSFDIEANEYEPFLTSGYSMMTRGRLENVSMSVLQVSEYLWNKLLEQAGISYT